MTILNKWKVETTVESTLKTEKHLINRQSMYVFDRTNNDQSRVNQTALRKQDLQTLTRNTNTKHQIYTDDNYDKMNIFKSLDSNTSLKVAKYDTSIDISLFDTGASRSGTNN